MEAFSAFMVILCGGDLVVTGGFPLQSPVTRMFLGFFLSAPEQMVEQIIKTPVIWDAIALILMSL